MAKKTTLSREFLKGLWDENPVLRMLLGLCPTLAVTTSAIYGFSMGLAVIFTLVMSSTIISLARNIIPKEVRIPTFIVVIATFVTITDKTLAAYFPDISKALGPFVPLIVVNCIILGRQEAFASKNSVGTIFGVQIMPESFEPLMVMVLQPGAFLTLGLMIGIGNWLNARRTK